jgi:hypothetical protein
MAAVQLDPWLRALITNNNNNNNNVCSPLRNKDITAFLRRPEQCRISSSQIAFCFTNLSRLVLEIFKNLKKHAQNLNTLQNNSASWDLQMGFNTVR